VDLRYTLPLVGTLGRPSAALSWTWQDDAYANTAIDTGAWVIGAYGVWSARLALEEIPVQTGELQVSVWGRNLRDEEYYLAHFNAGIPSAFWGNPRSFGVDLIYAY
jgi:iron complex outermembrane receptor protein